MIRILLALALGTLIACDKGEENPTEQAASELAAAEATTAEAEPIPVLSVADVASGVEAGELVPVDANGASTRREHGTLPGARLLTSSGSYDLAELPEDKSTALVFYCANEHCSASDGAAERARDAGFAKVHVMRDGIAGWVAAGKPTENAS